MIEVINLVKKYQDHVAVDNLSFTVSKGQILGFLGPNGAGKSTTMNIITGYISATEGSVKINGYDIFDEPQKAKKCIGYLPELPPLYMDMTVVEYLNFVAEIKSVKKDKRKIMINEIMELTQIGDVSGRLIKHLSKGYKQRVGLAQSIIGYPEVIILDEPTVGLDPKQIIEIRDLIKNLSKKHTIILSSHILSEISAICDKILIINKGKLVVNDTTENLYKQMSDANRIKLRVKGNAKKVSSVLEGITNLNKMEILKSVEKNTVDILLYSKEETDIREDVFYRLSKADCPIYMMQSKNMTLEDIFLQLTENKEDDLEDEEDDLKDDLKDEDLISDDYFMKEEDIAEDNNEENNDLDEEDKKDAGSI